jgi:hypothetical protein
MPSVKAPNKSQANRIRGLLDRVAAESIEHVAHREAMSWTNQISETRKYLQNEWGKRQKRNKKLPDLLAIYVNKPSGWLLCRLIL